MVVYAFDNQEGLEMLKDTLNKLLGNELRLGQMNICKLIERVYAMYNI